jgi:glyoxylase-like metal-dependent hydrolase (beta-lactamase superfamily II)
MTYKIETFILGPIENNSYLIWDEISKNAILVDPSVPSQQIQQVIIENCLSLEMILITHAHFDHIGGAKWFKEQNQGKPKIILRFDDFLWNSGGGALDFGFNFSPGIQPDLLIQDEKALSFSGEEIYIIHTPGHTPGHLTYYLPQIKSAFCGDLIFFHSIGRTDLVGSDSAQLMKSIKDAIFTLPEDTQLFPGHGQRTTVREEKEANPFLQ